MNLTKYGHIIGRESNVVRVDFGRESDPPAPQFPGANEGGSQSRLRCHRQLLTQAWFRRQPLSAVIAAACESILIAGTTGTGRTVTAIAAGASSNRCADARFRSSAVRNSRLRCGFVPVAFNAFLHGGGNARPPLGQSHETRLVRALVFGPPLPDPNRRRAAAGHL
jgi:hypothetical protein